MSDFPLDEAATNATELFDRLVADLNMLIYQSKQEDFERVFASHFEDYCLLFGLTAAHGLLDALRLIAQPRNQQPTMLRLHLASVGPLQRMPEPSVNQHQRRTESRINRGKANRRRKRR